MIDPMTLLYFVQLGRLAMDGIEAVQNDDAAKAEATRVAIAARIAQHDADWQAALEAARQK